MTTAINPAPCRWCGTPHHGRHCPSVKAIEFHPDGVTVKRVEFFESQTVVFHPIERAIARSPVTASAQSTEPPDRFAGFSRGNWDIRPAS